MGAVKSEYYYEALDFYESAYTNDPSNYMAHYNSGKIKETFEEDEFEALQFYESALQINPSFVEAKISKAVIYMKGNANEEARKIIFELLGNPDYKNNIFVLYNYGLLLMRFRYFSKAMKVF